MKKQCTNQSFSFATVISSFSFLCRFPWCLALLGTKHETSITSMADAWINIHADYTQEQFETRPTRVLIHGWPGLFSSSGSSGGSGGKFEIVAKTYRQHHTENISKNIIVVSWHPGSNLYHVAREFCFTVAEKTANRLDQILGRNESLWKKLKIVGFSLGDHIAGFIGKRVINGRVGSIIGLDPAGKIYDYCKSEVFFSKVIF